jgi:hypothetical protein
MTEAKHTPGPWEIDPPGPKKFGSGFAVQARTPEGPGFPTPSATGYYHIAEPPPHGPDKKAEQEANARLIAAAPDLLASKIKRVEQMERFLSKLSPADRLGGYGTLLKVWIDEDRAAIAKATGAAQ